MNNKTLFGYLFIVGAIIVIAIVLYANNSNNRGPIVFSPKDMMSTLWIRYKGEYIEEGSGRTLDKQQNNITTSEGQSYTMLRSVWMDDKETFDKSWKWTKDNLQHKEGDHLFAWLYGEENGKYQILTSKGGNNTATDADTDIALALIFAHERWQDDAYLEEAKLIINDVWNKEVITIKGKHYILANNLEKDSKEFAIINPSYLSPFSYRIFAKVDPAHPWEKVVDSSYEVLNKSLTLSLDKSVTAKLPPDWIWINKNTGELSAVNNANLTTNFSFDALRASWRIALDYAWYEDARAKQFLDQLSFLKGEWERNKAIYAKYSHDGVALSSYDAPAMYGGVIGYFKVSEPGLAQEVYDQKLKVLFNPDTSSWRTTLSYYDDNWAWFGLGLYNNLLPNLAEAT
jgi:endoglucanase